MLLETIHCNVECFVSDYDNRHWSIELLINEKRIVMEGIVKYE